MQLDGRYLICVAYRHRFQLICDPWYRATEATALGGPVPEGQELQRRLLAVRHFTTDAAQVGASVSGERP